MWRQRLSACQKWPQVHLINKLSNIFFHKILYFVTFPQPLISRFNAQHIRRSNYSNHNMATPQGPPRPPGVGAPIMGGRPLNPEEIEKRMTEEAKKHGLTLEQFKQLQMAQQRQFIAEAAKHGMSPQQFMAMQQQKIQEEAAKAGMTPQEFIAMKQKEAIEAQRVAAQQAQQAQQNGQPPAQGQPQQAQAPQPGQPQLQRIDLNKPIEAKPDALAVAKFLRAQDLKCRTCIFDGQRRDMFKGMGLPRPFCLNIH